MLHDLDMHWRHLQQLPNTLIGLVLPDSATADLVLNPKDRQSRFWLWPSLVNQVIPAQECPLPRSGIFPNWMRLELFWGSALVNRHYNVHSLAWHGIVGGAARCARCDGREGEAWQ